MSSQVPVEVVRAFFNELSGGDLEAIARYTSADVVYMIYGDDEATAAAVPWAGRHQGHAALKTVFSAIYAELRIEEFSISAMFGESELVAIFGHYRAASVSTGRTFSTPFAQRAKVVNGAIVECIMSEDSHAVAAAIRPDQA